MNRTRIILFLLLMLMGVSCKKITVEFTYTPRQPKAGEVITFTNTSTGGEDWSWDFGDNSTSTSRNPTHIYKKAGTYVVTMCASYKKQNKYLTATIQVLDSVPSFSVNKDSIVLFEPVTFSASIWNPFGHTMSYKWHLSDNAVIESGTTDQSSITAYFTQRDVNETISLDVTIGGEQHTIEQQFFIHDKPAVALLMLSNGEIYRQRLFSDNHIEKIEQVNYDEASTILNATPDTIDNLGRKRYFRNYGLFVSNTNGTDVVEICSDSVTAFFVDGAENRLYWSTSEGTWRMPLVQTKNNHFAFTPVQLNSQPNITKLAKDNTPR